MKKSRKFRRLLCALLSALLCLGLLSPLRASAAETALKTVRVAVDDSDLFITRDQNGSPVGGYAFEYIQYIASYAGWRVEYVPCGGFGECMEALEDARVDLMYDVSYTEERSERLLYPEVPMGTEDYCLYALTSDHSITSDDLNGLNGRKIGVTAGTAQIAELWRWCEEHGITPEIVEFASLPEKETALEAGAIDLNFEVSMLAESNYSALAKISGDSYFLVASRSRPDLIVDINTACKKIRDVSPFYVENLTQKYFSRSILNRTLSSEEKEWVSSHPVLRVGYMDDYLPFSDRDSRGTVNGIVKDIVPLLLENIELQDRLRLEYRPYADNEAMYAALSAGDVDVLFPVYNNIEYGVLNGISISSEIISVSADLAYRGNYWEKTVAKIAVNQNNSMQEYYTRVNFPEAEILLYDSIDDCLSAVAEGEAGCTILNGLRTTVLLDNNAYAELNAMRLGTPFVFSFAVREGETSLLSILNRSIVSMDEGFAFNYAFHYIGEADASFSRVLREYLPHLLALLLIIIALLTALAVSLSRSRKKLADTSFVENRLLKKFDAVYLVDLKRNEIRSVKGAAHLSIGNFEGTESYSRIALQFAGTVAEGDRAQWVRFSDPRFLQEYLSELNAREYTYTLPGIENELRRVTFDVVDRENGVPTVLLLSFVGIDDVNAKNLVLQTRLAEQNIFTRYFLQSFLSAYYINLDDMSWQIYKRSEALARRYPVTESMAQSLTRYIHDEVDPQDWDAALLLTEADAIRELLSKHQSYSFVFRTIDAHYLRCELTRGADDNHCALGFKDITEDYLKTQREQELSELEKEARYQKSFGDMINAALWSIDIDEHDQVTDVHWSNEFRKMFGFLPTTEDFPNTVEAWSSRLHPEDREITLWHFANSIASRDTEHFVYDLEYRILRKSGEYCWYHAIGRMDSKGKSRTMYGIIYDISADKQLQAQQIQLSAALDAARTEQQRTELLYEISGATKWAYLISTDGSVSSSSYGDRTEADSNPLQWLERLHPEDKERVTASFQEALADRTGTLNHENTFRLLYPDGNYHWEKSTGRTLLHSDGVLEYFGMSVDITEQLKEQERRAAERSEVEELRRSAQELKHQEFRATALAQLSENDSDISSFLNFYAEKLRDLLCCDQVVYMDEQGEIFLNNSPALGDQFRSNTEQCRSCPHYDPHSPIYAEGYTEMSDTALGWKGVPVCPNCVVKSSLTRTVQRDGSVCGYLAIHYILEKHEFNDYERQTMEEFTNLLSMALSRYAARRRNEQLERELEEQRQAELETLSQDYARIFALEDDFECIYDVELESGAYDVFRNNEHNEAGLTLRRERASDFFGKLRDDLVRYVHPEDSEELFTLLSRERLCEELSEQEHVDYFYRIPSTDGPLWYRIRAVYKNAERTDIIIGVFNAREDVEARQVAEQKELLEQQQIELEEALSMAQTANRAKTSFLFNMSHDIRTPMNAILGFTDMARKNIHNPERLADYLEKTRQAGTLLLSLINSVLEMSRIESGKAELNEQPASMDYTFYSIDTTMQELAKSRNISLSFELGDIQDRYIYADLDRANRVITNIISNSIKYSENGGVVRVRCEQVGRQGEDYGLYRYTFEDHGIGMSEEFQQHLFDEFARENSSTASGIQGSGLGLSVVKTFVDLMHGTIEFNSRQGEGTTFYITLPFRLQKDIAHAQMVDPVSREIVDIAAREEVKPNKEFTLNGKRVLVVEDNELNREIACYILSDEGITVEEADDGTTAVALLREKGCEYYDAVLMDIQMPIMNGYEATKAIRELYPEAKLPIIAVSANAFAEDRAASIAAGMNDHIAKPIDVKELFNTLQKLL